jgi:hypothetical protein
MPKTMATLIPPNTWRTAFLTASTWAGATATDLELAFALANFSPEQTPEEAVATLKHRRLLVTKGLLRVRRSRDGDTSDDEND